MKKNQGFTLMEMLVVILIIGILTSLALPQYRRVIQKAEATEAIAMLRIINDSGERLAAEYGYKSFQNFIGDSKANFRRMDMFDENKLACAFNASYTEMTCEHFKYYLNKTGNYTYAEKLNNPYAGTQLRLTRTAFPVLTCAGSEAGCDVYNTSYAGGS